MTKYEWILFDADNTLFHFDAYKGLQTMFSQWNVDFTQADWHEYEETNQPLWAQYQNGAISAQDLQSQRFLSWSQKLSVSPLELNHSFLKAMIEISDPIDGALNLIDNLKRTTTKLGIITNGFSEPLQHLRLERTGLKDHFSLLVVSELVGIAKPHKGIFEHALAAMGSPPRDKVLMVGDSVEADILGGINAGLHTCWLNAHDKPTPEGISPHYQVSSLGELEKLLLT